LVGVAIVAMLAGCSAAPSGSSDGAQRSAATTNGGACDATGVDAVLPKVGYVKTVTLSYAQASTSFTSASDACPLSEVGAAAPQAAIVIRNTSGQAAYLEASAECAPTDDAFLAVYAGATDAPTSDADRMACTGRVANGAGGTGALASDTPSASTHCPGLTVANAGAVLLAPCDTAVIVVQGASSSPTRPLALDLQLATP
jgi:hypothetical protein